eukprot:2355650-Rhodomonas_salina.1
MAMSRCRQCLRRREKINGKPGYGPTGTITRTRGTTTRVPWVLPTRGASVTSTSICCQFLNIRSTLPLHPQDSRAVVTIMTNSRDSSLHGLAGAFLQSACSSRRSSGSNIL